MRRASRVAWALTTALLLIAVAVVNTARAGQLTERQRAASQLQRAQQAEAEAIAPSLRTLGCTPGPAAVVVGEADLNLIALGHPDSSVRSWRCADAGPARHPSYVNVVRTGTDGVDHAIATLVTTAAGVHVDRIAISGGAIEITSADWLSFRGVETVMRFRSPDGLAYRPAGSRRIATACRAADLSTRLDAGRVPAGQTVRGVLISLVNTSRQPCALGGYLSVQAWSGDRVLATGSSRWTGPPAGIGGVNFAPVVVIGPSQRAVALAESVSTGRNTDGFPCPSADRIVVSLSDGEPLLTRSLALQACLLRVFPVVLSAA